MEFKDMSKEKLMKLVITKVLEEDFDMNHEDAINEAESLYESGIIDNALDEIQENISEYLEDNEEEDY